MVEINSKDYHDFVIKNGKLIAEFEQMYQKSEEVPWHQDKQEKWLDIRILIELIRDYGTYDEITDFGCGYGYFLNQIGNIVGNKEVKLYGYDVSETACDKGKILFPHISFKKLDLMSECHTQYVRREEKRRSLFLLRGTLWYVFPKIKNVVENIAGFMKIKDNLLISQNFPPLQSNFVGKETIPNPQAIINLFKNYCKPIKSIWLEDHISMGNDNWFIVLMERI